MWEKSPHPKTKTPARYPRNAGGSSRREPRRLVSFNCGCGRSLTRTMIERPAKIPGMAESQKTRLKPLTVPAPFPTRLMIASAASGPATAPAVSAASSKPNARPRRNGNRIGQQRIMKRRSKSPPHPAQRAHEQCPGPPREQSIEPCGHSRQEVACGRPWLASLNMVAEPSSEQFREARQGVRDSLDQAESDCGGADRRQKQRQDRRPRLVTKVRQETVDRKTNHVPVQPVVRNSSASNPSGTPQSESITRQRRLREADVVRRATR